MVVLDLVELHEELACELIRRIQANLGSLEGFLLLLGRIFARELSRALVDDIPHDLHEALSLLQPAFAQKVLSSGRQRGSCSITLPLGFQKSVVQAFALVGRGKSDPLSCRHLCLGTIIESVFEFKIILLMGFKLIFKIYI